MIYLTRRAHFNAAHKLYNPNWSEQKNKEVFGKCANTNWHGHNFDLLVTVKGEIDPETGFVIDLKLLKKIIEEEVIELLDHKNLNLDVPFMKGKMASTENLVMGIWKQLEGPLKNDRCALHSIELFETPRNSVKYFGE